MHPRVPEQELEERETNWLSVLALFLSIVWLFGLGAIAGIVLGGVALGQIRRAEGRQEGRAFAIIAIATGVFGLGAVAMVLLVAIDAG